MRSWPVTAGITAALTLSLSGAALHAGTPATPECTPEVAADTQAGARELLRLTDGLPPPEADRILADQACLLRVSAGEPRVATAGSAEVPVLHDVAVSAPAVYKLAVGNDTDRWIALTEWEWHSWPDREMSGADGVATWFDTSIEPVLQVLHHTGWSDYGNITREDAHDRSGHGVSFLFHPERSAHDLNVAVGQSALVFEGKDSCKNLTVRGAYAHSWNTTAVSDLSVSGPELAVEWTQEHDRALALSPSTHVSGVCP